MRPSVVKAFQTLAIHNTFASHRGSSTTRQYSARCPQKHAWSRANLLLSTLLKVPGLRRDRQVRPVASAAERRFAQQMLYREYRRRGYCAENALEQHVNLYSITPACKTLVLMNRDRCLGTVSVITDSVVGLPLESLFPNEANEFRTRKRTIAEVGLLSLDCHAYGRGQYSLTSLRKLRDVFSLFHAVISQARKVCGVSDLLIVVHPKHENLYRFIGFRPIGETRAYSGAEGNPALPMSLDLEELERRAGTEAVARYLVRDDGNTERFEQHAKYSEAELLVTLSEHPTLWPKLEPDQRHALIQTYPRIGEWSRLLDSLHHSDGHVPLEAEYMLTGNARV